MNIQREGVMQSLGDGHEMQDSVGFWPLKAHRVINPFFIFFICLFPPFILSNGFCFWCYSLSLDLVAKSFLLTKDEKIWSKKKREVNVWWSYIALVLIYLFIFYLFTYLSILTLNESYYYYYYYYYFT